MDWKRTGELKGGLVWPGAANPLLPNAGQHTEALTVTFEEGFARETVQEMR